MAVSCLYMRSKLQFLILFMVVVFSSSASHIKSSQVYYVKRADLGVDTYEMIIHTFWRAEDPINLYASSNNEYFVYDLANPSVIVETGELTIDDTLLVESRKRDNCAGIVYSYNDFKRVTFRNIISGLNSPSGYRIDIRVCNMIASDNIFQSDNFCALWNLNIPPGIENNSPVNDNILNPFICLGDTQEQVISLFDPDGDSLSYRLAAVQGNDWGVSGGITSTMTYNGGYTYTNPTGDNYFSLNASTGQITTFGNSVGRFIVKIAVDEHRNGSVIATTFMEYEFVSTVCASFTTGDPMAGIDFGTFCGNEVRFESNSRGGSSYFWDFGVESTESDTSNLEKPTYRYADGGTYTVTFILSDDLFDCKDTLTADVRVETPTTDFDFATQCLDDPVIFTDQSQGAFGGAISRWEWFFGDGEKLDVTDPTTLVAHEYDQADNWKVTLVTHDANGCGTDTFSTSIVTPRTALAKFQVIPENAANLGQTIELVSQADNYSSVEWVIDGTTYPDPLTEVPVSLPPGDYNFIQIAYDINDPNCNAFDTIPYRISNSAFDIPTAFTPNDDGDNDRLTFIADELEDFHFVIYNQWGTVMYETTDPSDASTGWDGKFNGLFVPAGAYPYFAKATNSDTKIPYPERRGTILVIR